MTRDRFTSWGNYPIARQQVVDLHWEDEVARKIDSIVSQNTKTLAVGMGRSYGDSCYTTGGKLLRTIKMDKILAFDLENGSITCEAGITLDDILRVTVPHGWFLPVTPGTKFITLGGAIANDVHGKNHHVRGTIGCFVDAFGMYRSDVGFIECTPTANEQFFNATIGGLGLTGVILWIKLRLTKIASSFIDVMKIRFNNIKEYFDVASEFDGKNEFSVAWIDCTSRGHRLGRGIYSAGNFSDSGSLTLHSASGINVPFTLPFSLVNKASVKIFNNIYYRMARPQTNAGLMHYGPFFYPLDGVLNWNRIYGRSGFQQYQCLIPEENAEKAIPELLSEISKSGYGSFLVVLKKCGKIESPGLLSFPVPGVTLAIDFPQSQHLQSRLLDNLNSIVENYCGRIYPAKDAQMSARMFQKAYPTWRELDSLRDPILLSSFWSRVTS